jgi:hypothetical protein
MHRKQTGVRGGIMRKVFLAMVAGGLSMAGVLAAQQPEAQVRTGSASGVEAEARVQSLLADHQFFRVEQALSSLPPEDAQLYRGVLANRRNDAEQSIALLEPLVERVAARGDLAQEKLLRKALAEDYLRAGAWAKAAAAYDALAARLGARLSADEQDEIELPLKLLPLARGNPATTVEPCEPFTMQVEKNPLGMIDVPVFVDARPRAWMLDPTAPFNLIARSTAKEVGLKLSAETATIRTLTGRPIVVRMTVIPRLTLAGRLTLRNVTAFVYDDADYAFAESRYQVEGVLGYAGLQALGSVTITGDDTIEVRPSRATTGKDDRLTTGVPFFLDGDRLIVALGKKTGAQADASMYVVDAGSQQSYLTSRYYNEHSDEFAGQKMELLAIPGAESFPPQPAFMAETAHLAVGDATVAVHYIQVITQPLGAAAFDDVYGVLGIDVLDQLGSYTFDYRTMQFAAKPR